MVLQIQHGFPCELGREYGVRRGQALRGFEDSPPDRSSRTRGGGSIGRNAGRSRVGLLCDL